MSQADLVAQAVHQVVRGEKYWRELNSVGVTVDLAGTEVRVFSTLDHPVLATGADVASGWLRHIDDDRALREWARIVHGAVGLIELDLEDHPLGEALLDALWRISFGEPVTEDMTQTARRILIHT